MRIGLIGAGKVGFSLGKFFVQGGVPVTGYWSRHRESMREAALFTGTKQYDALEALVQDSDALFLTVPDGVISSVFQTLKEFDISEKQICHCSGAMTAGEAFPGIGQTAPTVIRSIRFSPSAASMRLTGNWRVLFFAWKATAPISQCGRACSPLLGRRPRSSLGRQRCATMPPAQSPAT